MQKCLSWTCGYKFRIIQPTAIIPTRGLSLAVFPKDITDEEIVKRYIHNNFLTACKMIEGRSIISGDRDTIVSRLTDRFSLCNISCRAALHPRHNPRRVWSIIFQLRSIMSQTAAASVKNIIALGKNQGKMSRFRMYLNFYHSLSGDWLVGSQHPSWNMIAY